MASIRQKFSRIRRQTIQQITVVQSPLAVQNLTLQERNKDSGNWRAVGTNGSTFDVTKRGINSGVGLQLPGLTVKQGLGRFAN